MAWNYSNTSVQTVLTAGIAAGDVTITVGDATGLPSTYPYSLILDYGQATVEVVTVTSGSGATLTVTRGQDGTSAQSHLTNAVVVHGCVARDLQESQNHIAASTNVHGVGASSAVVGSATIQTLTNKTIDGGSNTLANIPNSAIISLAASKLTGNFGAVTSTGAVTAATTVTGQGTGDVVPIVADVPNGNVSDLAQFKRNSTVKAKVDKDGNITTGTVTSGNITATGTLALNSAVAGDKVITAKVTGDANSRLFVDDTGKIEWDDGTTLTGKTYLKRIADGDFELASYLQCKQLFTATDDVLAVLVNGDSQNRWSVGGTGVHHWSTGALAPDTDLSRAAVGTLNTSGNWQVGSVDQGRGCRQYNALNIAGNTFGAAEAIITTLSSFTFVNGRVYEIRVRANITDATANNVFVLRGRKGTLISGAQFTSSGNRDFGPQTTNGEFNIAMRVANYSGADIATQWVLTGITSAGTATFANSVDGSSRARVEIWDIGSTSTFTNEPAIT